MFVIHAISLFQCVCVFPKSFSRREFVNKTNIVFLAWIIIGCICWNNVSNWVLMKILRLWCFCVYFLSVTKTWFQINDWKQNNKYKQFRWNDRQIEKLVILIGQKVESSNSHSSNSLYMSAFGFISLHSIGHDIYLLNNDWIILFMFIDWNGIGCNV